MRSRAITTGRRSSDINIGYLTGMVRGQAKLDSTSKQTWMARIKMIQMTLNKISEIEMHLKSINSAIISDIEDTYGSITQAEQDIISSSMVVRERLRNMKRKTSKAKSKKKGSRKKSRHKR